MMESQTDIDNTLSIAGEDLSFLNFSIKGIPGTTIYNIQNFDSPYDIERQDFDFQVSSKDVKYNNIKVNDSFTCLQDTTEFAFKILENVPDLTGWRRLKVKLVAINNV